MSSYCTVPFILSLFLLSISTAFGQLTSGGHPFGLSLDWKKEKKSVQIGEIKGEVFKAYQNNNGTPLFALPIEVENNLIKNAYWTEVDGELLGLLSLKMSDDSGVAILFKDFELPKDARMFIYNSDGQKVLGAYTSRNNNFDKVLISEVISGDEIIVELVLPTNSKKQFPFAIDRFYKVMDEEAFALGSSVVVDTGFNSSYDCHQNINCALGDKLRKEQRGVVRIVMVLEEGLGFCTGSLMNNTSQDRTPYILSAYHCQDTYTPLYNLWRFDFNFEADACETPTVSPGRQSIMGCQEVAGAQESDFILFRLSESIPQSFDAYFNGWDRRNDYEPMPTTFIHHPAGDIKKISFDFDNLRIWASSTIWDNDTRTPANSHFRLDLEEGSHQPGSSGGPLFDSLGRVVAQLHGGNTDTSMCNLTVAYFGRLSQSWDGDDAASSLAPWLDPLGLDTASWDGIENALVTGNTFTLLGEIVTPDSKPLSNVSLKIEGSNGYSSDVLSDGNGNYTFANVPMEANYTITPTKDTNHGNGLSASDLVIITNHILGLNPLTDIFKIMAADVNQNNSISGTDIVQIQNVILGLRDEFVDTPSWGFLPKSIELGPDNINPDNLKITGFKYGDVNNSASNQ